MRIRSAEMRATVLSAQEAARLFDNGSTVGMSGLTGAGDPKAVPLALAERLP